MTKDEALDLALEALEYIENNYMSLPKSGSEAITAIKQARALDKKAENARELGLDYEPEERYTYGTPLLDAFTKPAPVQEPVAARDWEGAEYWMPLAWELCADECGEEACTELIWEGGPIPEPWGDRWLKYEDEAKRLIALVQKHTTPPAQPAPAPGYCKHCKQYSIEEPLPSAQRQWVGLTNEDIELGCRSTSSGKIEAMQKVEAKLKEKNT